jgi:hypothetical protein
MADSRRRVILAGVLVTLAMAVAGLAYVVLTPDGPHRAVLLAVTLAAAADAGVVWLLRDRLGASRRFDALLVLWNVAHIAVAVVVCALDGGMGSPFSSIFFISVAFAAVSLARRAVLVVALLDIVGVFVVVAIAGDPVTGSPASLLWAGGLAVTAAVCAVIADDRARRLTALQEAKEEMLRRLARVVEYRDDETAGHVERMSEYTEILARRLGLEDLAPDLRLASTMHDVGKVGVPDAILLKPGPLTPDERREMERHAEIGCRMLSGSGSDLLDLAATIALTHHERFDGGGYPNGLAGEEIPLEGRIVAVADVFDALTSDRVYKRAMPVDEAARIIRAGARTQFDPRVVDAFDAAFEEIEATRRRHAGAVAPERAPATTRTRTERQGRLADRAPGALGRA